MKTEPNKEQIANLKAKVAKHTSAERINIGAKILSQSDGKFQQSAMMTYLVDQCGLTTEEYLSALNQATNGELLKSVA